MKIYKKILKNSGNDGYALLFTIMIISVVSVITAGLLNASTKQLMLSSLAKDSQTAFYQADTASDCAFYADLVASQTENFLTSGYWFCGGYELKLSLKENGYTLTPQEDLAESNNPCFDITVSKTLLGGEGNEYKTKIIANGYNVCKKSNPRIVERQIEINY